MPGRKGIMSYNVRLCLRGKTPSKGQVKMAYRVDTHFKYGKARVSDGLKKNNKFLTSPLQFDFLIHTGSLILEMIIYSFYTACPLVCLLEGNSKWSLGMFDVGNEGNYLIWFKISISYLDKWKEDKLNLSFAWLNTIKERLPRAVNQCSEYSFGAINQMLHLHEMKVTKYCLQQRDGQTNKVMLNAS